MQIHHQSKNGIPATFIPPRDRGEIIINDIEDFAPAVGGEIQLEEAVYVINAQITTSNVFVLPPNGFCQLESRRISGTPQGSITGTSVNALFKNGASPSLLFALRDIQLSAPNGPLFNVTDLTLSLFIQRCTIVDCESIGITKDNGFTNIVTTAFADIGDGFVFDQSGKPGQVFFDSANFIQWKNVGGTMVTILGDVPSIQIANVSCTPNSTESFLNIDPATQVSTAIYTGGTFIDTLGGAFFKEGLTGDITAFADAGGGSTTVTSTAHGLSNGTTIFISDTINYNGGYSVSNVTANTFDIVKTFTVDDARGKFDSGSLKQDDIHFTYAANSNIPASNATATMTLIDNATVTTVPAVDLPVKVEGIWSEIEEQMERFIFEESGRQTYIGLETITLPVISNFRGDVTSGANKDFAFCLKHGNDTNNKIDAFADAGGGETTVTSTAHGLQVDDRVNITDTINYNSTFTVTAVTANTFDIDTAFVADDATGFWGKILDSFPSKDRFDNADRRSVTVTANITFATDDYVELFLENLTDTADMVIDTAKFIIN